MAQKKKPVTRKKTVKGQAIKDEQPWPQTDPCCCPPRVMLWGSTSSHCCVIGNRMLEDELLQVRADANASVNPPGSPPSGVPTVNADGSGGSEIRTMLRKDVDLIEATIGYRFEWEATGLCKPLVVRVRVEGDVQADIRCAPERGQTDLVMRKVQKAEEVNSAQRGSATATITVIDCTGQQADCSFTLNEP